MLAGGTDGRHQLLQAGGRRRPDGAVREARLPPEEYLQIVAATNFKQRVAQDARVLPRRPAELRRRRHAQPARVRPGLLREARRRRGRRQADRASVQDAGLRAGASTCGVPEEICTAPPTTDTYSLPQGQDEFYFSLPYRQMDLALWAADHGVPADEMGALIGITPAQAALVYADIAAKRRAAAYLHAPPEVMAPGARTACRRAGDRRVMRIPVSADQDPRQIRTHGPVGLE